MDEIKKREEENKFKIELQFLSFDSGNYIEKIIKVLNSILIRNCQRKLRRPMNYFPINQTKIIHNHYCLLAFYKWTKHLQNIGFSARAIFASSDSMSN